MPRRNTTPTQRRATPGRRPTPAATKRWPCGGSDRPGGSTPLAFVLSAPQGCSPKPRPQASWRGPMPELLGLPVPGKWVTSLTDAALAQQLPDKFTRRPVALHPYGSGSSRRWLLSWVKNSGPDFEDWGWTMGDPVQTLAQKVDEHERVRLFLIEPVAAGTLAAVWFIRTPNTPWLTWDWVPEIAAGDLKAAVPAGHRLTCVRALNTGASKVAAIWT